MDGIREVVLKNWDAFHEVVSERNQYNTHLVWRGQRDPAWQLRPTLDRLLWKREIPGGRNVTNPIMRMAQAMRRQPLQLQYRAHLEAFRLATRGRRGAHPDNNISENEWWALGQHFGLATPLLDWTTSPFVAAFFAFADDASPAPTHRCIWALSTIGPTEQSRRIAAVHAGPERPPIVEFVRPMSDENPRLVNQGGLFTRGPDGVSIDDWVRHEFKGDIQRTVLTRFSISSATRQDCLRVLNRMNINHLSLFPDLTGASRYCNLGLEVGAYLPDLQTPTP
ncbi:MAG: FRG domain-containing protein [Proteobacteria bacterium]|nr:FRG domain-containing protein [Pseudomonadota bacterium]